MSLRLRLTLLYSAILALTLIAFSVALYLTVSSVTYGIFTDTLAAEARRLIESKDFRLDKINMPVRKFAMPQPFVQTRGLDGSIYDRANLGDQILPLSPTDLALVRKGQSIARVAPIEDRRLLVFSMPIKHYGSTDGIIQVARALEDQERALSTLQQLLVIGGSMVTVAAFGIGWGLSGTALHPIDRLTQTAHTIGVERDFGRRVNYAGPDDEVGRLATTFNTMLAQLQAAYHQVEQALQAQRRFVADASHELRTPLTTIRGNMALLRRTPPISEEDHVAVLADVNDECERLIRLVNDLLALARADAGRPLRSDPVALHPLLEELCRRTEPLNRGQTVTYEPQSEAVVLGDADALRQVFVILLDNALKFTPPGGSISITVRLLGERVMASIRDTGGGIAPAALPHIFERFYRGDSARTGGGAGLGLAIAKALVEAQHGTISAESQPGHGSVFTVTLPLAPT